MPKKSRNTRQKELIASEIDSLNSLFDAEELCRRVRKKDPAIGMATVYRHLRELKEKNVLHAYTCNKRAVFSKEKKSHCDFVCTICGKTAHFEVNSLDFLKGRIMSRDICHFQIEVKGICGHCKKQK